MTARRILVPVWLLGLFTFTGPVGMHIFVPALPDGGPRPARQPERAATYG